MKHKARRNQIQRASAAREEANSELEWLRTVLADESTGPKTIHDAAINEVALRRPGRPNEAGGVPKSKTSGSTGSRAMEPAPDPQPWIQGIEMTEREEKMAAAPTTGRGIAVTRYYTTEGLDPFASVQWSKRTSRITNPDGSVVF